MATIRQSSLASPGNADKSSPKLDPFLPAPWLGVLGITCVDATSLSVARRLRRTATARRLPVARIVSILLAGRITLRPAPVGSGSLELPDLADRQIEDGRRW